MVACSGRKGEADSPPQQFVDSLVRTTRRELEETITFLVGQPVGAVSDETWRAFEETLLEVDETFEQLRLKGYDVAA